MSLIKLVRNGLIWSFVEQSLGQIINFFVTIVLARKLLPDDFGLIGLLFIFVTLSNVMVDGGLKTSLIRKKNATDQDYSTVFYANVVFSLAIYFTIFFIAPFIADYYHNQEFCLLLRVFSLSIVIQSVIFVQSSILIKDFNFKKQTLLKIPAILLSSIVGIYLALNNYGIWSLVWMYLLQAFFTAIFHYMYSTWKPSLIFDKKLFYFHFNYGSKLTIVEILNSITSNIYQIVIGKFYNIKYVGYYSQSLTLRQVPISNIYGALSKLLLPVFSKIQDEEEQKIIIYKKILYGLLVVMSPILIILAFFSNEIIVFLYTSKWRFASIFLFYLSIAGIFNVIYSFNSSVLSIIGNTKVILKMEMINKIQRFFLIFLAIIFSFSINSFLYIVLISSIINYLIVNYYTSKVIKISNIKLISIFILFLSISMFSFYGSYLFFKYSSMSTIFILNFIISISFGLIIYLILIYLIKPKIIIDLLNLLKKK
jgi:O-antigen/teichoic acid export membrane protein